MYTGDIKEGLIEKEMGNMATLKTIKITYKNGHSIKDKVYWWDVRDGWMYYGYQHELGTALPGSRSMDHIASVEEI